MGVHLKPNSVYLRLLAELCSMVENAIWRWCLRCWRASRMSSIWPPPAMPLEVSNFEKRQHCWKFCSSEFVTLRTKNRLWNKQGVFWKTIQVQSWLCLSQLYLARHLRLSVFRQEFNFGIHLENRNLCFSIYIYIYIYIFIYIIYLDRNLFLIYV